MSHSLATALILTERLRDRILIWTEEEIRADHPPRSGTVTEAEVLTSESIRASLRLAFPARLSAMDAGAVPEKTPGRRGIDSW